METAEPNRGEVVVSYQMKGKVALVVGASSGIGRATAVRFAKEGAAVVVSARRKAEGEETVRLAEKEGGKAVFICADVARVEDVRNLVNGTVDTFGRLDFAVNNAAIEGSPQPILEMTEDNWADVISINLTGALFCMKFEAEQMIKQEEGGAIVNVGSINSFVGAPGYSPYVASKHGLLGLTRCASAELAASKVRVNVVCPGVIETPMNARLRKLFGDESFDTVLRNNTHLGRMGKPEEIAANILWLCSSESSYLAGSPLISDGGFLATM